MKRLISTIGDLCIETKQRDPQRTPEAPFTYIDISTINKDTKKIQNPPVIKGIDAPSRARKEVQTGDILVSTVRPNLNAVAIVPPELNGQIASTGFCVLRVQPKLLNNKYLFYRTITPDFISHLTANMRGANYPAVTDGVVKSAPIPLPPLSEQRRIVEILDRADALRRKRAEADAKGDRILPTIFIKMFGDPSTWTYSTNTKPLSSIVNIQSGGTPSKQNSDYWNGKIPWVSAKDMKQDIILGSIDHISELAIKETNIKYVEPGAILVLVRGMTLAHTIPIALADCRLTINQDMKALQPNCKDIDSTYLHAALKASSRRLLSQVGTAAHGTRKIDTDELLKLPILIPAKKKLDKFRQNVTESRMILSGINQTKEKIEKLFEILLNRAFSGELTAKWREAHMKELLAEMEEQVKAFQATASRGYEQLTLL